MITFLFFKNIQAYLGSIYPDKCFIPKTLFLGVILLGGIGSSVSIAQEIITKRSQATVSIIGANIAQAEANAQLKGKQQIIQSLLKQYLPPQTLSQAQSFLEAKILNNPDRFIESIQIINEHESKDRKSFTIKLEAQVFPSRLIATLKNLNFAFSNDPIRRISLAYDSDNPLWNRRNKINFQRALKKALTPFRIRVQQTIPSLTSRFTQVLSKEIIKKSKSSTILFFDFNVIPLSQEKTVPIFSDNSPLDEGSVPTYLFRKSLLLEKLPSPASQNPAALLLNFRLYENKEGKLIANDSFPVFLKNWEPRAGMVKMLEKASFKWNDIISEIIAVDQQKGNVVQIKIQGLSTPTQETYFIQKGFEQDLNWKQLNLHTLTKAYIIYQGYYTGSLKKFVNQLKKQKRALYKIQKIKWNNNLLDIKVRWIEKAKKLRPYQPVREVERWAKRQKKSPPKKRVPRTDVKSTYILPQSQMVYDQLRSRGDSTSYEIRWLKSHRRVYLEWHLIGKTKLNPVLSIYDQNRNLVKQFALNKDALKFNFKLPKKQKKLLLRLSDRIGYIGEESGNRLSVRYVLKARFQ